MDLLDATCAAAYLECQVVEFPALDQRLPLLTNGSVDFLLDILVRACVRACSLVCLCTSGEAADWHGMGG